jgi:hypothetical protein
MSEQVRGFLFSEIASADKNFADAKFPVRALTRRRRLDLSCFRKETNR